MGYFHTKNLKKLELVRKSFIYHKQAQNIQFDTFNPNTFHLCRLSYLVYTNAQVHVDKFEQFEMMIIYKSSYQDTGVSELVIDT